jgi:hypothetical protein
MFICQALVSASENELRCYGMKMNKIKMMALTELNKAKQVIQSGGHIPKEGKQSDNLGSMSENDEH